MSEKIELSLSERVEIVFALEQKIQSNKSIIAKAIFPETIERFNKENETLMKIVKKLDF